MKIVYPIFLQCSQFSEETFWKSVFEDLAYGVCPSNVKLNDNGIYITTTISQFNFYFEDYEAYDLYVSVKELFKKNLNIIPKSDKIKQKFKFYQCLQNKKFNSWADIRKKNTKLILIKNYVIKMKTEKNLTSRQMKQLLSLIQIGFHFKLLTLDDITYDVSSGSILDIQGVSIVDNRVSLDRVFKVSPLVNEPPVNTKIKMKSLWDKQYNS
jgi:hypothetical protein